MLSRRASDVACMPPGELQPASTPFSLLNRILAPILLIALSAIPHIICIACGPR